MTHEERRAAILDVAQALFFARGWENVTIADILAEAGISKGGFYHHFSAKEDLLDGIMQRATTEALASAERARTAACGDAVSRFNAFLAASSRWKAENGPQLRFLLDAMMRPGNDLLFHRIARASNAAARPILAGIIAEGMAEGSFQVADADLTTEMIMALSQGRADAARHSLACAQDGRIEEAAALMNRRLTAEAAMIDRLLGLPRGSIVLTCLRDCRQMLCEMAA